MTKVKILLLFRVYVKLSMWKIKYCLHKVENKKTLYYIFFLNIITFSKTRRAICFINIFQKKIIVPMNIIINEYKHKVLFAFKCFTFIAIRCLNIIQKQRNLSNFNKLKEWITLVYNQTKWRTLKFNLTL